MKTTQRLMKGITLIEMLLVMVIVGAVVMMGAAYMTQRTASLRIDRTSGQMQQILNAGMSYYISNNNTWPTSIDALITAGYLPTGITSPWSSTYGVYASANNSNFYVYVKVTPVPPTTTSTQTGINNAKIIAGTLPLAFTTIDPPTPTVSPKNCVAGANLSCYVVATVNVPPQTLGDSKAVSFAGLYHNGACVIAPSCPSGYKPQAFAVPVAVNGFYSAPDKDSPTATCNAEDKSGCIMTYYPLNGFTAYTTEEDPTTYDDGNSIGPIQCGTGATNPYPCDDTSAGTPIPDGLKVWRVCISVTTSSGEVSPNKGDIPTEPNYGEPNFQNPWGQLSGTIMVMTRCTPYDPNTNESTEETGSDFTVWSPSS